MVLTMVPTPEVLDETAFPVRLQRPQRPCVGHQLQIQRRAGLSVRAVAATAESYSKAEKVILTQASHVDQEGAASCCWKCPSSQHAPLSSFCAGQGEANTLDWRLFLQEKGEDILPA